MKPTYMKNNLKKGSVVECHYDGNTEEFTITFGSEVFRITNISADNHKLYPFIYLHRKENKLTLSVK